MHLAAPAGAADLVGAFAWDRDASDHGGFSAIEVGPDGRDFVALSDRTGIVRGTFRREDGAITGVEAGPMMPLTDLRGGPMDRDYGDSEGLAMAADGGLYVSFEGTPRVWRYDGDDATGLPRHPDFDLLAGNRALEALAIDGQGRLYTLPERPLGDLPFPVWRLDGDAWALAFTLPDGGYAIAGADFDDRGRLYLLERRFLGVGFQSRVRRVTIGDGRATADDVLLETELRQHDNLEGLAVWRDAEGALRLTMISDDNFNFLQRTEIVEYRVPD